MEIRSSMTLTFTKQNINEAAAALWAKAKEYQVWAFYGEMGSGKTTFIRALCEVLEVASSVGSPTYAIINEYVSEYAGTIFHMDWYRLKDEEEAIMAGVEDALYSNHLCFVEWPEKASGLLPNNTVHIHLEVVDSAIRHMNVSLP